MEIKEQQMNKDSNCHNHRNINPGINLGSDVEITPEIIARLKAHYTWLIQTDALFNETEMSRLMAMIMADSVAILRLIEKIEELEAEKLERITEC
jgi:hypothetical protein